MASSSALEIVQQDAVEWKKRALAAEGKVRGYARLRALADDVVAATVRANLVPRGVDDAIDELSAELAMLDVVHPSFDFFNQGTSGLVDNFWVRETCNKGAPVSAIDLKARRIEIAAGLPRAAKAVGLLYQIVQLADRAAAEMGGAPSVSAEWLQERAPALLVLLISFGLVKPELGVAVKDVAELDVDTAASAV